MNEVFLKNLKLNQTFWEVLKNYFYYIFSLFYLFYRNYTVSKFYFHTPSDSYLSKGKNISILDRGILLEDFKTLIPYENVMRVQKYNDNVYALFCLAKIEDDTIVLGDSIIVIELHINEKYDFVNDVVKNMYYHLKYNKINIDILKYSSVKKFNSKLD